ncbi:MAG: tRNA (adenosine(37)-N6)-threonylcarbamoyltransferase complex transferase subunit TsaD [Planctomycetota bacterium]
MRILGIESSCDETAAAIVDHGRAVVANAVASQHELHAEYGGVVPELASRAHAERILPVVRAALDEAGCTLDSIDAVAVGHRPGLIGALLVGVSAAKALAWSLGKPLVGVDHVHAHLWAGFLGNGLDPAAHLPALGLVVSGGHSAIYRVEAPTRLNRLGATIDDAVGEAYDKAAAILGLGHPGGPAVDRLASDPAANPMAHELPVSRLGRDSLDFSFSGLKTALLYAVRGVPQRDGSFPDDRRLDDTRRRDLAASFQRAACRAIELKLARALEAWRGEPPGALIIGGGVAANSRLRRVLLELAERAGLAVVLPELAYCVDNAAMIAGLAHEQLRAHGPDGLGLRAVPTTAC